MKRPSLVFASANPNKLREMREIIGDRYEILGLADIGCHIDIPETGNTCQENAIIKARYVKDHYGFDCFADDSGLEITALGGQPGVHTARFAGDDCDDDANMALTLKLLDGIADRSARFVTVIALLQGDKATLFEGEMRGTITTERRGSGGFGYDQIFQPEGYDLTYAQLSEDEKNAISHRRRAVAQLLAYLQQH